MEGWKRGKRTDERQPDGTADTQAGGWVVGRLDGRMDGWDSGSRNGVLGGSQRTAGRAQDTPRCKPAARHRGPAAVPTWQAPPRPAAGPDLARQWGPPGSEWMRTHCDCGAESGTWLRFLCTCSPISRRTMGAPAYTKRCHTFASRACMRLTWSGGIALSTAGRSSTAASRTRTLKES
eukprot:366152-Chlamydomonas_euryale.AAC.8